jgi:hypothetical protein
LALFESIDTLVSVGAVLSNVTDEESVVETTWVPAFPVTCPPSLYHSLC